MKLKPFLAGIVLLGIILLVTSIGTVAQVWGAYPRYFYQGNDRQPATLQFISKRSPFFISLLVKPEDLALLARLDAKPEDRGAVRHQWDRLKQQLQQYWSLNYEQDIQPWLDHEITVAMTGSKTSKTLDPQGYLVAMVAKDAELAQKHIGQFWQGLAQQGGNLGFERYQGVSLTKLIQPDNAPLKTGAIAGAVLDKYVLFANDIEELRRAIDNLRSPSLSIGGSSSYQDRLLQINQNSRRTGKIAIAYFNPQELLDKSNISANLSNVDPSLANLDLLTSISLDRAKPSQSNFRNIIATPYFNLPCSKISNAFGNNKQTSLLSCLDKPYLLNILNVVGIAADSNTSSPNPLIDLKWLAKTTARDPQQATQAISALDQIAKLYLTVGEVSLVGLPNLQQLTVWTALTADAAEVKGKVTAVHGQIDQNIYWSNSLEAMQSALNIAIKSNL